MRMLQVINLSSLLLTRLGCDAYPPPLPPSVCLSVALCMNGTIF